MSNITDTPVLKKHKKHKKEKDKARNDREGTPSFPGTPTSKSLRLILKVGGSSTPEHSDSPGPSSSLSVLNVYDEDSQQSNTSLSQLSHTKKSKKKDKKNKKEKKHKHRHKDKKKRDKDDLLSGDTSNMGVGIDFDSMESASSSIMAASNKVLSLSEMGMASPSSQSQFDMDIGGSISVDNDLIETVAVEKKPPVVFKQKPVEKQPFQKLLDHLLRALQKKDPQYYFAWPVTDKIAPGYSQIIKNPMDFSTMKTKVDNGSYNCLPEFIEDFKLMCNNAMIYNANETVYFKAAKKLLQSGLKILDPEKIRSLLPLIPSIRVLSEESLGFCLIPEQIQPENAENTQSEEDIQESLDPTKSIHYVPPHPNDPPDLCGAFTDDLTAEEILYQARIAAREASHRLATKKPNSKMGFLRQREDGSTSLAILTPTNGVLPGTQEQPVTLNVVVGKLSQGTTQLQGYKDEKKNIQRTVKPLYYGAFSSFAPSLDSTFSNLTSEETELVRSTYGDETSIQYAESMIEFAKGCDYGMYMVDELLDTITKGEHKKTVNVIEDRKRVEEEEARIKKEQEEFQAQLEMEWESTMAASGGTDETSQPVNVDSLRSLGELGIDTSFVEEYKSEGDPAASIKLEETAHLISDLQRAQNNRLRLPTQMQPPHVPEPSEEEMRLADRITENLTQLAKNVAPGSIVSEEALMKAMGVDLDSATFRYGIPDPQPTVTNLLDQQDLTNINDIKPDLSGMQTMGDATSLMTDIPMSVDVSGELSCVSDTVAAIASILPGEPTISSTTGTPPDIITTDAEMHL